MRVRRTPRVAISISPIGIWQGPCDDCGEPARYVVIYERAPVYGRKNETTTPRRQGRLCEGCREERR